MRKKCIQFLRIVLLGGIIPINASSEDKVISVEDGTESKLTLSGQSSSAIIAAIDEQPRTSSVEDDARPALTNMSERFPLIAPVTEDFYIIMCDVRTAINKLKRCVRILEISINQQDDSSESFFGYFLGTKKKQTTSWNGRQIEAFHSIQNAIQDVENQQKRFMRASHLDENTKLMNLPDTKDWQILPNELLVETLVSVMREATQANENLSVIEERLRSLK